IPAFEVLEARGFKVYLVNGRHIKNVLGRKSDVADCPWIQKLHALGLLNGSFRPDGEMSALRAYLRQSLELYDFYTGQVAACDAQIQQQYAVMKPRWEVMPPNMSSPSAKPRRGKWKNEPASDVRADIIRLTGVDIAAVDGIGPGLAQTILSEIGTDMSKWPTDKHFASWSGLAPHNDISGGKVLHSRTLPTHNRAGQAFRQAATSVARAATALGAHYRRKRAQGAPSLPKWRRPTKLPALFIICSRTMSNTSILVRKGLNTSNANETLLLCARKQPT
ncbi:MAG: transposase, partial [Chloroflexota bacterium]